MQYVIYINHHKMRIHLRCDSATSIRRLMATHAGAVVRDMTAADWEMYGLPHQPDTGSSLASLHSGSGVPPTPAGIEWEKRGVRP